MDQQRRFCTLLAVALVMGAVATAEGAAGVPGSGSGAAQEAVRQIRLVDRDALTRWISEFAKAAPDKPAKHTSPKFGSAMRSLAAALRVEHHRLPSLLVSSDHRSPLRLRVQQGLLNLPPPVRV